MVALLLASMAGCSDDDEPPEAGQPLTAIDFRFAPSTITVTAGSQVMLRITNQGKVAHNLSIPTIEADIDYQPGAKDNVIFVAPASGQVEFFCKFHKDQGMTGAFKVQ
ncbi:MAG: cupredoxin domain-containing protein [Acidimicrobiales bacterium]